MIIMYLTTRPCSGIILTSYHRVESANLIDDKLSVAIDKYNIHKKKFSISLKTQYNYEIKKGLNFNFALIFSKFWNFQQRLYKKTWWISQELIENISKNSKIKMFKYDKNIFLNLLLNILWNFSKIAFFGKY